MKQAFNRNFFHNCSIKHLISGLFILSSLILLWPQPAQAADDRLQKIQAAGKLRVCIWPDYYSISYRNQKTAQLEGIDIDLSQAFAKDLGVAVEYVNSHFGVFIEDIEDDRCDIAMFGVGITPERAALVDYSEPYLSSSMYGVTSKTNPALTSWEAIDRPGIVVCVQKGTYMEGVMRNKLFYAQLMAVTKNSQRELEVRSGRADVFISDYPYGQKMLQVYDWAKILTPQHATEQIQYAYAMKKGQPQWQARINEFVRAIKADGRLEQAAQKNNLLPIALIEP